MFGSKLLNTIKVSRMPIFKAIRRVNITFLNIGVTDKGTPDQRTFKGGMRTPAQRRRDEAIKK
jgi:hypothetical protein